MSDVAKRSADGGTGSKFPPAVREVLDRPLAAYVATVSSSGAPQSSVVWFERRGDELVFFAVADSAKIRNLRRDPRVTVTVIDPDRQLGPGISCFVRLAGRADLRPAERGVMDSFARLYGNADGYPGREMDSDRLVMIHMEVERISGVGPFGGGHDTADSWRDDGRD